MEPRIQYAKTEDGVSIAYHVQGEGQPLVWLRTLPSELFHTEIGKRAADHAVQIFGGLGCMDEKPVSRDYRDIRAATIGCVE